MEQISGLYSCRIRQTEDGFDKMEQFGQVKTDWSIYKMDSTR